MKIAVCMKQVPMTSDGNMDQETGVLLRTGLEPTVNVYDLAALEAALRMKEQTGAQIHVFTMGPARAEDVLRKAFSMGADEGYLICDKAFAGADVLATSYTLMQAIRRVPKINLIICGKQTTDGDTGQVSGALSKWLNMVHLNWVTDMCMAENNTMAVRYHMENRQIEAQISCPCLLSVEKDAFTPRMPSLKLKINAKKKQVHYICLEDLGDGDVTHYGLLGSATRVTRIFPPPVTKRQAVKELNTAAAVTYMMNILGFSARRHRI